MREREKQRLKEQYQSQENDSRARVLGVGGLNCFHGNAFTSPGSTRYPRIWALHSNTLVVEVKHACTSWRQHLIQLFNFEEVESSNISSGEEAHRGFFSLEERQSCMHHCVKSLIRCHNDQEFSCAKCLGNINKLSITY